MNLAAFGKRLRALQEQGLEVDVVGRGDRINELRRKLVLGRFLKKLILAHGNQKLVIALVDAPEFHDDCVNLCLSLKIRVGSKPTRLTRGDKSRLESFLESAIQKSDLARQGTRVKPQSKGAAPRRRASSGM